MKNVLVFPCGSEIALEIARSLEGDRHFHLIGGTSIDDHGRFVFSDIETGIPWVDSEDFIPAIKGIVKKRNIDLVYPASDMAVAVLKAAEQEIGAYVIASPSEVSITCLSKRKTYRALSDIIRTPAQYTEIDNLPYPIFAKPDIGHSSIGTAILKSREDTEAFLAKNNGALLLELLTGDEYTVDCFTDRHGELLFSGARKRQRTMNGISVRTSPVPEEESSAFSALTKKINSALQLRGAWFAQFKESACGDLTLLEVASRFGGSSGLYRGLGVNFALLSIWDALGYDVSVSPNKYTIEMDRALDNRYKIGIRFNEVFLDYDDTIVMSADGSINPKVMQLVFSCINRGVRVTILSRHRGDLLAELKSRKIDGLFSRVIHLPETDEKSRYIDNSNSIFIDDSYAERMNVQSATGIPTFGLDMLDALT